MDYDTVFDALFPENENSEIFYSIENADQPPLVMIIEDLGLEDFFDKSWEIADLLLVGAGKCPFLITHFNLRMPRAMDREEAMAFTRTRSEPVAMRTWLYFLDHDQMNTTLRSFMGIMETCDGTCTGLPNDQYLFDYEIREGEILTQVFYNPTTLPQIHKQVMRA